jgi:hypothetical protein
LLICLGGGLVFVGGLILLVVQDEAPKLLARAAALEGEAQHFIDERDGLLRRLESLAHLDQKRLALIEANGLMRETLEQSLLVPQSEITATAQLMLDATMRLITTSIGFDQGEQWAISIFQVQGDGAAAELRGWPKVALTASPSKTIRAAGGGMKVS